MSDETPNEGADRMAHFLHRKLPPCPICGVDEIGPDFVGHMPDGMIAVYHCHNCPALWDHEGQPFTTEEDDDE